jgi:aspartyl/asparaginyl beta-hydroxylase (cupin superfamily)
MTPESFVPADALPELSAFFMEAVERHGEAPLARLQEAFMAALSGERDSRRAPMQDPTRFYVPGLRAKPWYDPSEIPAAGVLQSHWSTIRKELEGVLERRRGFQPHTKDVTLLTPGWKSFHLKFAAAPEPEALEMCPRTVEIVENLPGQLRGQGDMAMFSAVDPGGHIRAHCGPWNTRLTIHLGLIVPSGCELRVATETRRWVEGECLVFDDSFEHEAWNRGDRTRFVLLVDVWHPDLTTLEVQLLTDARNLIGKYTSFPPPAPTNLDGKRWWT